MPRRPKIRYVKSALRKQFILSVVVSEPAAKPSADIRCNRKFEENEAEHIILQKQRRTTDTTS